jgi:chorismate dehydratase
VAVFGGDIGEKGEPLRVGAFQRLRCNAWPLVHFLSSELPDAVMLELQPTEIKSKLATRQIDLALLPSAELMELPSCKIVSDCCIACAGTVRSVKLVSKKPIEKICTLALDDSSRSSILMCEILLLRYFGLRPARCYVNAGSLVDNCDADAFVVVGNTALGYNPAQDWGSAEAVLKSEKLNTQAQQRGAIVQGRSLPPIPAPVYQYDLGSLWFEKTGLPFVFATWASCEEAVWKNDNYIHACKIARNRATNNIENLVNEKYNEYPNLPLQRNLVKSYLTESIIYKLGDAERSGLQLFFDLALQYGFTENKTTVEIM